MIVCCTALTHAATPVPQWSRVDAIVKNPRRYADPFRDVTLDVTFTRPDGTQFAFWGFHDGGDTWRIRFMPSQTGAWKFTARFSDGASRIEGDYECVRSDLPGMIAVHAANPLWFGFAGGDAALIRGLHIGDRFFAGNWAATERAAFLDWARQQGYNTLSIASHYLNRNTKGRGAAWETPALWPLNPAEYQRLETMLDDLARRRMIVFPFAGFFGRDSNFPKDPAEQTLYLRYVYARFGAYWNVLLNVGGPEPLLRGKPFFTRDEVNRLGAEIQRLNVYGHPLTVHNRTGNDEFRDEPWHTFGTLQGPKTIDRARLSRGLLDSHHPRKPLLAQETLWSGNVNHIRANQRDYTDDELRKNAFVIHFSAAALIFADNDGDSSTGFSGTLTLPDRKQARHDVIRRVWDICAKLPFGRLSPRQDLVRENAHAFCLAEPGRTYLVYLDRSAPVSVQIEHATAGVAAPFRVTWIDAQTGKRQSGAETRDGRNLTPPEGGDDWIALIER